MPATDDLAAPAGVADPGGLAVADVVSRLRRAMRRAARAQGSGGQPGRLPGGLSVAQLEFLSCLAENPGARPGQLARLLRLAPSSVATLVNGISRAQLVQAATASPTGARRCRSSPRPGRPWCSAGSR